MQSLSLLTAALSILVLSANGKGSCQAATSEAELLAKYSLPDNVNGATAFSILYGTPLYSFRKAFDGPVGLQVIGTNKLLAQTQLSSPSARTVVSPNADTIYGFAVLDLADQDLAITLPPMQPDRYYSIAFFDPYGYEYANIGSVDKNEPGEYLLQPAVGTGRAGLMDPEYCSSAYKGCIESPTYDGIFLVRVLAKNNGTDAAYAASYVKNVTLTATNKHLSAVRPLTPADLITLSNDTIVQVLDLTASLAPRNPPQDLTYYDLVPKILRMAGIHNGTYIKPLQANLTEASLLANKSIAQFLTSPSTFTNAGNGWSFINPNLTGNYANSTNLPARDVVAIGGYLANTRDNTIYPTPKDTAFSLGANESYIFTFSAKPPIASDGFWSVTAYTSDNFLIPNPAGIYEVGDRSNITYSNGSLVYPTVDHSSNGTDKRPFQILIQHGNLTPPANWTHNWLPSVSNSSAFHVIFRLYAPQPAAYDGSWAYPVITKQAAITA